MKKNRDCCLFLLLIALAGCQAGPGSRVWFYTYGSGPGVDSLNPVSFLELRPDGSYTRDFDGYDHGTWEKKDQQLLLTTPRHKTFVYTIDDLSSKELQLTVAKNRVGHFESKPLPSANPGEDPFSVDNNQWRIPATHKESDADLRHRLYNHCGFWEKYFSWALDNKLEIIDVRSTPTPIKIYGNGFGLKPFGELPPRWKALFFDEEDCEKANAIIEDIFQHKTIAWANTDSKYKMFLGAFEQLEGWLR